MFKPRHLVVAGRRAGLSSGSVGTPVTSAVKSGPDGGQGGCSRAECHPWALWALRA